MYLQTTVAALLLIPISLHAGCVPTDQRETVARAIKKLSNPSQSTRDGAARQIRNSLKEDPAAANDVGEAHWRKKFEAVKLGMTASQIREIIGSPATFGPDSGPCSGQSCTISLRLDDYWSATLFFSSQTNGLLGVDAFTRGARHFWVEPPKNLSGKWTTYFVNGSPSYEIEYSDGHYVLLRALHDNGLLSYEQKYPKGQIDGPEIGRYPDGSKMYEGRYKAGKRTGRWTHWYANSQKQHEFEYDENGKETGQAAWNEDGIIQFANGSLAQKNGPTK